MTEHRREIRLDGEHMARPDDGAPIPVPGVRVRKLDLGRDLAALAGLIAAVNRHDGVDWIPTEAGLRNDYAHPSGQDPERDVMLAWAGARLVGRAETDWRIRAGRVHHFVSVLVHPDHRHRGLGRWLLDWTEARVVSGLPDGSMGPIGLPHLFGGSADLEIPDVAPFAAAAGYHVDGYGVLMIRSLDEPIPDIALPAEFEVRPVQVRDHRPIWDADTEAFQDHREPMVRTEEDFVSWYAQPDLDTSIWEVAWDGDEVAGSVLNFVFREENAELGVNRGWLEHVTVRRPWRRRGLASALMVRSMRRIQGDGPVRGHARRGRRQPLRRDPGLRGARFSPDPHVGALSEADRGLIER